MLCPACNSETELLFSPLRRECPHCGELDYCSECCRLWPMPDLKPTTERETGAKYALCPECRGEPVAAGAA